MASLIIYGYDRAQINNIKQEFSSRFNIIHEYENLMILPSAHYKLIPNLLLQRGY